MISLLISKERICYFQLPLVLTSDIDPVISVSLSFRGSYGDGSNAVKTGVPILDKR